VVPRGEFLERVIDVARWSDEAGCEGSLIYTDNSLVDPWLVAQAVIENTDRLCPLVAVQPVYMHPYSVAKMVATLGYVYGRRVYLNMVAGGFVRDLQALDDDTEHDRRYDRLVEYTSIIKSLLASSKAVSFEGEFYRVNNLRMSPSLPSELFPGITVSGSSAAGAAAARAMGAIAVQYPRTVGDYEGSHEISSHRLGIRIGVIARERSEAAWDAARNRFPGDRSGQLTHQLAMKTSDSVWHRQLSALARETRPDLPTYWLHPFENYKTFCPYLVGSYDAVGAELGRYIQLGFRTFILDIPESPDDLGHTSIAFDRAQMAMAS
jgi:alkanesulfonate monooxygenase